MKEIEQKASFRAYLHVKAKLKFQPQINFILDQAFLVLHLYVHPSSGNSTTELKRKVSLT